MYVVTTLSNLFFSHPFPVVKAVHIVCKKHNKANCHGYTGDIRQRGDYPEDYQNDIVCGIGKSIIGTSEKCQGGSKIACGDGKSAYNKTCRAEDF